MSELPISKSETPMTIQKITTVSNTKLKMGPEYLFTGIHNVFNVSQLRKYYSDPLHIIKHFDILLQSDLSYIEQPIHILHFQVRKLRNRSISQVEVLWGNHKVEEVTWEREDETWDNHPHLFE